jgi:hypothetical protein
MARASKTIQKVYLTNVNKKMSFCRKRANQKFQNLIVKSIAVDEGSLLFGSSVKTN